MEENVKKMALLMKKLGIYSSFSLLCIVLAMKTV